MSAMGGKRTIVMETRHEAFPHPSSGAVTTCGSNLHKCSRSPRPLPVVVRRHAAAIDSIAKEPTVRWHNRQAVGQKFLMAGMGGKWTLETGQHARLRNVELIVDGLRTGTVPLALSVASRP